METKKHYANIKITKLKNSEIEITGEISAERLATCKTEALKKITKNAEMDGFRKGHVPSSVVSAKIGEAGLLEEASEIALAEEYPKIVIDHKLDVISRPEISITKMAFGNPLEFKIKTTVMPEIKLADYKKIAKGIMAKEESTEVTEKEIEAVILEIRRNRLFPLFSDLSHQTNLILYYGSEIILIL